MIAGAMRTNITAQATMNVVTAMRSRTAFHCADMSHPSKLRNPLSGGTEDQRTVMTAEAKGIRK